MHYFLPIQRKGREIRTHFIFLPVFKHVIDIALDSKCHIWLNFRKNLWQIMHDWHNSKDKTRSMVGLQSAPSKNWNNVVKKPPNPTMGTKAGQSKVSNKMNCNVRLIAKVLARGAAFINICRNRWYLKKKKKEYFQTKQAFYCDTSFSS